MSQGLLVLMCGWMVLPIRLYAGAPSIGNTCHVRRHALRNRAEKICSASSFEAPQLAAPPRSSASLLIQI